MHKELKIDRAFVNGAADDRSARAILESSVLLAKKLNMKIVAEGVETQEQLDYLRTKKVQTIQGYLLSPPIPAEEFRAFVQKRER